MKIYLETLRDENFIFNVYEKENFRGYVGIICIQDYGQSHKEIIKELEIAARQRIKNNKIERKKKEDLRKYLEKYNGGK